MDALAASTLRPPWHRPASSPPRFRRFPRLPARISPFGTAPVRAFRLDLDELAKKVASGEAFRETWRSANTGFEQLLYESRVTAQRLDSRYSISSRIKDGFQSAALHIRDIDSRLGIGIRLRSLALDFARNWPRYRNEMKEFLETPLGKTSATIFFIWFVLSGWFFRILIFSTWVLPLAAPLIMGSIGNNLAIQGTCPSCGRQFIGYRYQVIRCANCTNIVWKQDDSPRGRQKGPFSTSDKDVIDIEIDKK